MASVKISALPAATTINLADTVPIVQGGTTKQGTFSMLNIVSVKDGTDPTKVANFDASGISTATTRTITLVDAPMKIPAATSPTFETPTLTGAVTLDANSGFRYIDTQTPSGGAITFSSIPAGFHHLQIAITGRSDNASNTTAFLAQANGDSTSGNYEYVVGDTASGAFAGDGVSGSDTKMQLGYFDAASNTAATAGTYFVTVPAYDNTSFRKTFISNGYFFNSGPFMVAAVGTWKVTSAITSIKLYPAAGNLVAGSIATLIMNK